MKTMILVWKRAAMLAAAAIGITSCAVLAPRGTAPSAAAAITDPTAQLAVSPAGMVASASRIATGVGSAVLAQGGNAVDAAAATAFALAVTEPSMSGLGGRASIVIRTGQGEVYGIDGLNRVPMSYRAGAPPGYDNAAIPGVPAALVHAVEKYGSWPLTRIMAPAIRLAEEGYPLTELEAQRLSDAAEELRGFEGSRKYFLRADGTPYRAGEVFVQRDLARTLRGIAQGGADAFYRGWIADSIHEDMVKNGGFITRDELAAYSALPAILVRGSYRGHSLVSNYDPAAGHVVIQALQMLEQFDVSRLRGAEYASVVGQAMQLALSDRSRRFGSAQESAARLTSREHAVERAREIGVPRPPRTDTLNEPQPWWLRPDQDNTTHLSVVDRNRMAVALTQSLGPILGTRVAAPRLGFLYATRLGSTPGSRPGSTISPTVVTDSAGRVKYVLGAAGDARIITAVIQTLSRAIDQGMPLDRAVAAPRVHPMGRASLRVEKGTRISWSDAEVSSLRALGFQVDSAPSTYFARVHAVFVDHAAKRVVGVAEPRGAGGASGPR